MENPPLMEAIVASPQTQGAPPSAVATRNSLYVGDLDRTVDEGLLYQIFSKVGPVASIRVCKDSVSKQSLGYAYVNYIANLDPHAAEKAIELLSYTIVKARPMRIMWADREAASVRKSGVGNVFVKGLTEKIDSRTLHDTFEVFGAIVSAKVSVDENGKSLGYGYVQYEKPESAADAVQRANKMLLEGRQLTVAHYTPRETRGGKTGYTNLYVKNLPSTIKDEEELTKLFQEHGEITSAVLARTETGDELKGFGFVNFKEAEAASKAVEEMNGKELEGMKLFVGPAQKKAERKRILEERYEKRRSEFHESTKGRNLYVKHLSQTMTDEDLKKAFSKFGTITSAKIMTDDSGKSRCFGFVCFSTIQEASTAHAEMNNQLVDGQHLYVALAQPKAIRQAQLERDRVARLSLNMGLGMGMGMPGMAPGGFAPGMGGMPSGLGAIPQMWTPSMGGPQMGMQQGRGRQGGRGQGRFGGRYQGRGSFPMRPRWNGGRGMAGSGGSFGRYGGPPVGGRAGGRDGGRGMRPQAPSAGPSATGGTSALASAPPEQQKIMLGERLYPLVQSRQPEKAAKITGMLLEMDNVEVLYLIENLDALNNKIDEAVQVLSEHDVN